MAADTPMPSTGCPHLLCSRLLSHPGPRPSPWFPKVCAALLRCLPPIVLCLVYSSPPSCLSPSHPEEISLTGRSVLLLLFHHRRSHTCLEARPLLVPAVKPRGQRQRQCDLAQAACGHSGCVFSTRGFGDITVLVS